MTIRKFQSNVNIVNPLNVVYMKGSEDTDNSVRLILEDEITTIERRAGGVWNPSDLELGGDTLLLGHNISISAIAHHVQINSVEGEDQSLVLDVPFDDTGTGHPRTPVLGQRIPFLPIQPDFSSESTFTSKSYPLVVSQLDQGFVYSMTTKTGAVAATDSVTFTVTEGFAPGGALFFKRVYPASLFPANSDIILDFPSPLGFNAGDEISLTFTSDSNISLKENSSNTFPYGVLDFQPLTHEDILSFHTGTDQLIIDDNTGNILVDSSGNVMSFAFKEEIQ